MMPTIMFALVNAAAVALGWWVLRRRRPAPGPSPEQPYPGYEGPQYEGPLRYADHALKERMVQRAISEPEVRAVLANPESVTPGEKGRMVVEGISPFLSRRIRIIADTSSDCATLWVVTVVALDSVRTKVKVRAAWRTRILYAHLDQLKDTGADISISETDQRGGVTVTITSPIIDFRDAAVEMVQEIAEAKK